MNARFHASAIAVSRVTLVITSGAACERNIAVGRDAENGIAAGGAQVDRIEGGGAVNREIVAIVVPVAVNRCHFESAKVVHE